MKAARVGVRLTNYYTSGSTCTPTRAAFMTGRYQQRVGLVTAIPALDRRTGLPASETSLVRMLKGGGCRTALVGKWHLGLELEFGPNAHGFDEFFGFRAGHLDYYSHRTFFGIPDLWENTERVDRPGYLTDLITDRAVAFVERQAGGPFFLFLSYNAPHDAWQAPDHPEDVRSRERWDPGNKQEFARRLEKWSAGSRSVYARMVERADAGIAKVLDALDRRGLARDTLVVFSSDNGGERFSRNWPLFHHKGSLWEGGIHVPCLVRWPAALPAEKVSDQPVITMDLTATILAAAGIEPPPRRRAPPVEMSPARRALGVRAPARPNWSAPGDLGSALLSVLPVKRAIIAEIFEALNAQRRPTAHISPDTSPAERMAVPCLDACSRLIPSGGTASYVRG